MYINMYDTRMMPIQICIIQCHIIKQYPGSLYGICQPLEEFEEQFNWSIFSLLFESLNVQVVSIVFFYSCLVLHLFTSHFMYSKETQFQSRVPSSSSLNKVNRRRNVIKDNHIGIRIFKFRNWKKLSRKLIVMPWRC